MLETAEYLQKLNRAMLGLGAPVERDNVGYNQPDYIIMNHIGKMDTETLAWKELYSICQALGHYTNTQLAGEKEKIVAAYRVVAKHIDPELATILSRDRGYLHRLNRTKQAGEIAKWQNKATEKTITIHEQDEWSVLVSFTGYIAELKEFAREENLSWEKSETGFCLRIPMKRLENFINFMGERGYGTEVLSSVLMDTAKKSEEELLHDYFFLYPLTFDVKPVKDQPNFCHIYIKREDEKRLPEEVVACCRSYATKHNITYRQFSKSEIYFEMAREQVHFLSELIASFSFATRITPVLDEWMEQARQKERSAAELIDLNRLTLPFAPYPYQIEDAKWMLKKKRCICADDMGCGKTFISVLVGSSVKLPKLVVCPVTLLVNWRREILSVTPDADVRLLKAGMKELSFSNDWNIIGYSMVAKYEKELLEQNFQCVFFDEAHYTKSINNKGEATTKRGRVCMALGANAEYCYPLTGTPIPTSNRDIFNLLSMINHPIARQNGKWSYLEFGKQYCDGKRTDFGWDFSGNSNTEELHTILASDHTMIRRKKKDVLPHLTKQRVFLPVEVNAGKVVKETEDTLKNKENFLAYAMTARRILSMEKAKVCIELAENILLQNQSVVIITCFRDALNSIKEHFGNDCVVIEGGMSVEEKQKSVDLFQAKKARVCVANIVAAGVGITLTAANHMICCDADFTPANLIQAEDRICRQGQTEPCVIQYVYAENVDIDRIFYQILTEKFSVINEVIDNNEGDAIDMVSEVYRALLEKRKAKNTK